MHEESDLLVSIVLPTYNHAEHIGRAIQSVIDQTYQNWELIIIDNFSTDDTDEVVSRFDDTRIKFHKIKNEGIISKSRNKGIFLSKGQWVAFLDSDDWWSADKLKKCLGSEIQYDLIYHKLEKYRLSKSGIIEKVGTLHFRDVSENPYTELLAFGPSLTTSAILVRKDLLRAVGQFDEAPDIVGGEDYELWLRLAQIGAKFKFKDFSLGYYLVGGNHVTSAKRSLKIVDYIAERYFDADLEKIPSWMHKSIIASYLKIGEYSELIQYIRKISRVLPPLSIAKIFLLFIKPK